MGDSVSEEDDQGGLDLEDFGLLRRTKNRRALLLRCGKLLISVVFIINCVFLEKVYDVNAFICMNVIHISIPLFRSLCLNYG